MNFWRWIVGLVAFATIVASQLGAAFASPPIYAYDAATQHLTATIGDHAATATGDRASVRTAGTGSADTAHLALDFVAAETGLATESNLATVTEHLNNIDALASHPPNAAMISRIQSAMAEGRALTPGEQNFMTHELTEANAMARGVPQDLAHEMAGQTHPLFQNHDPEVIKQFPEYFNSNWRKAWGLP